ncbi:MULTISPECIES: hypothetical protein [Pseudomonas]|uniref:DUF416 family protein n=1 Tax=Pseudomonas cichorii TaxID=36746 RepID=A0ABQ1DQM7_PSECI|nr:MULTISPECIES: hypothetical protein [Pseudomonas]QVE17279.1 hypothetical protein KGD89_00440 [Pseudomonas cichorii]GFM93326.1 hypothetical protein PSCICP_32980 [Pseudomonas cichorii]SDO52836.1 hypothetical protein SAMN05216599_1102 [Pseudomonas cichorii]
MNNSEKVSFFVLLRSFDRFGGLLKEMKVDIPKDIILFLDKLWACLASDSNKINIKPTVKIIDSAVVDEQDASTEEVFKNLYMYALSDLLMFFSEGEESLSAAESSIVDAYDYIAAQNFLLNEKGGKAMALSEDDERKIKNDPIYMKELDALRVDREFAEKIGEWERVLEFR